MAKIAAILLGAMAMVPVLASCLNRIEHPSFPAEWGELLPATTKTGTATGALRQCPDLSGVYEEFGKTSGPCHGCKEDCYRLSYDLLSGKSVQFVFDWCETSMLDFPLATHVELMQNEDASLDIILFRRDQSDRQLIIHSKRLRMEDGDYACDEEGLTLQSRNRAAPQILQNMVESETRTFTRAKDRALIMRSKDTAFGNLSLFPFVYSRTVWVRWPPAEHAPE